VGGRGQGQDAAVDLRVQRLDAAAEDLGAPVYSLTLTTATPSSSSAAKVPPVESTST
jgi:hypothetical protein